MWESGFKVSRCSFFSRVEGNKGLGDLNSSTELKGRLLPVLGLLPVQWLFLCSPGFEEQGKGQELFQVQQLEPGKGELVSLASEIQ